MIDMKKSLLLLPLFLISCSARAISSSQATSEEQPSSSNDLTTVALTTSNYQRYIKTVAYTGTSTFHWWTFSGVLTFAIYDVTIGYQIKGADPATLRLDASGGGETAHVYGTNLEITITEVKGSVVYRL